MPEEQKPYWWLNDDDEYFLAQELKKRNPNAPQRETNRPGGPTRAVIEQAELLMARRNDVPKKPRRGSEFRNQRPDQL